MMRPERIREVPSRSRLGDISYVDSQTGRRYTSRAHAERAAMRESRYDAYPIPGGNASPFSLVLAFGQVLGKFHIYLT